MWHWLCQCRTPRGCPHWQSPILSGKISWAGLALWHGICALSEAWRGMARNVSWRFGRRRWSAASMCVCSSGSCGNCVATTRTATDGCFWMTCSLLTCWRFSIPPFGLCEPSRTSARRSRRSGISRCRRSAAAHCRTLIAWSSRSAWSRSWRRCDRGCLVSRRPSLGDATRT